MPPDRTITLKFDESRLIVNEDVDIRNQLSAVVLDGDYMWLACDEGCRLERLTKSAGSTFAAHHVVGLETVLPIPAAKKDEADIEGLAVDDGWLWLVGSHAVKRKKPKRGPAPNIAERLSETSRDGNRHLLARVPLAAGGLEKKDGARKAAMLPATAASSAILDTLREDVHFAPFIDIPGKDNGFDIEGLAVRGMRVWVGLRGPVLREFCCVLEFELQAAGAELRIASYRKHFLRLNGLGVRDLALLDNDLLILAGPTMAHDGPNGIWRWRGGARAGALAEGSDVSLALALPQVPEADRPEGLAVLSDRGGVTSVLVVYDAPSRARKRSPAAVRADVFRL